MPIVIVCTCFPVFVPMYVRTIEIKRNVDISAGDCIPKMCIKHKIWRREKLFIFCRFVSVCLALLLIFIHAVALHTKFYESSKFDVIVLRYIQWNRRMPFVCNVQKMHWNIIWNPIWLPLNRVIVFHETWTFLFRLVLFRLVVWPFNFHKIGILMFGWWSHCAKLFHFVLLFSSLMRYSFCGAQSESISHWSLVFLHSRPESSASD